MTRDFELVPPIPAELQRIADNIKWSGLIGFWVQLILGIVSVLALAASIFSIGASATRSNTDSGAAVFFAVGGLIALAASAYLFLRYTRMARKFYASNPAQRPRRAETLKVIGIGRIISLVGTLLSIAGTQAVVGNVLFKALTQTGNISGQGSCAVAGADIFGIQANTTALTANFVGLAITLWLLNRLSSINNKST